MSDLPPDPNELPISHPAVNRTGRQRWQIGLQTLCLLVVAVAVWTTFFVNRRQNALLQAKIAVMRPLARDLVIDDLKQIAVVKLNELWMGDHRWDIYLPDGKYRLCMATHEVARTGLAPIVQSNLVGGGRHQIALE